MPILLGDNPLTQVKIIELHEKPVNGKIQKSATIAGTAIGITYSETDAPQKGNTPLETKVVSTPEQKVMKAPVSVHQKYGFFDNYLEIEKGNQRAAAGQAIGNVVGGAMVGLHDEFLDKNTTLVSDIAGKQDPLVGGGYEAGKALGGWAKDRFNDIKNWGKNTFQPDNFPKIPDVPKWKLPNLPRWTPDINFPNFKLPDIKLPEFDFPQVPYPEPNFDKDKDFDLDKFKRRPPERPRVPEPLDPAEEQRRRDKEREEEFRRQRERELEDELDRARRPTDPNWQPTTFPPVLAPSGLPEGCEGSYQVTIRAQYELFQYVYGVSYYGQWNDSGYVEYSGRSKYFPTTLTTRKIGDQYFSEFQYIAQGRLRWSMIGSDLFLYDDRGQQKTFPIGSYLTETIHHQDGHLWNHQTNTLAYTYFNVDIDGCTEDEPPGQQPYRPPTRKRNRVEKCLFDEEKIKKIIRSLKAKIEIPIVTAEKKTIDGIEKWIPKVNRTQIEVIAIDVNTAASTALIYRKLAEVQIDLIKMRNNEPPIAVIPEWWQVRIGADRPQLVCLFGEKNRNGKIGRTRWPLTIPHYIGPQKPQLPAYTKGQWEGILTLRDNSKLIVNAVSKSEAERVISALQKYINPQMLQGSESKIGIRKGKKLKQVLVFPTSVRFFKTGQKNTVPTWTTKLL